MANANVLTQKQAIVAELSEKLRGAASGVLVDYKGITVAEDTALRAEMRKANVEYGVYKNTLLSFAVKNVGYDELDSLLSGTTSIAVSADDAIAPARVVSQYSKKLGDRFNIKGGFVDGKILSADELMKIAEIPSKEALVASVLGAMLAPITALAFVLKQVAERGGAVVSEAEEPAAEAAEEAAPAAE